MADFAESLLPSVLSFAGHKTQAVSDRYNIVNEQELLTAGERMGAYVAKSGS